MLVVRRIRVGEGQLFRQVRLASLREAPYAFASSYEAALQRSAGSWNEQADGTAQGSDRATFIAFADDSPIGLAALYRQSAGADTGELLQVWVAPEYRHTGTARCLMDAVFQWAEVNGFRHVLAKITQGNARALAFYRRYGFDFASAASTQNEEDCILVKEVQTQ